MSYLKRLFFLMFLFICAPVCAVKHDISVCAIFQNEAPYLQEWIEYHQHIGVEHFYLYNNDSNDDYMRVLAPYIKNGEVELFDWPDLWPEIFFGYGCQPAAYRDAIQRSTGKTTWLAIIDLDEYILPMKGKSVKKVLKKYYNDATAIYVNWLQFGTGGINIGPGSILNKLIKCAPRSHEWNTIGKSIVRPDAVDTCVDPHFCKLKVPLMYFNGDAEMKLDCVHHDKYIRINHYTFRDEWYFWNTKVPRYLRWHATIGELQKKNDQFSQKKDRKILEIIKKI